MRMASLRPNLDTVLGLPEPLMSHNYVIQSVGSVGTTKLTNISTLFPENFFQNRTESLDIPFKTFNVESRHIMATNRYYAGFGTFNSFNANFYEDQYCNAIKGFMAWQELIVITKGELIGAYSPAADYQTTFEVHLLDQQNEPHGKGTFSGVFPTQVTNLTMSGGEVSRTVLQVSFSVNKVDWTWM
jgi:hypothetical protein